MLSKQILWCAAFLFLLVSPARASMVSLDFSSETPLFPAYFTLAYDNLLILSATCVDDNPLNIYPGNDPGDLGKIYWGNLGSMDSKVQDNYGLGVWKASGIVGNKPIEKGEALVFLFGSPVSVLDPDFMVSITGLSEGDEFDILVSYPTGLFGPYRGDSASFSIGSDNTPSMNFSFASLFGSTDPSRNLINGFAVMGIDRSTKIGISGLTYDNAAAVPIPSALWLFGPSMAGLIGLRRRFR